MRIWEKSGKEHLGKCSLWHAFWLCLLPDVASGSCLTRSDLLYKHSASSHLPECSGFYYILTVGGFQWGYQWFIIQIRRKQTNRSPLWFTVTQQRLKFPLYERTYFIYVNGWHPSDLPGVKCEPRQTDQYRNRREKKSDCLFSGDRKKWVASLIYTDMNECTHAWALDRHFIVFHVCESQKNYFSQHKHFCKMINVFVMLSLHIKHGNNVLHLHPAGDHKNITPLWSQPHTLL